MELRHLRYFLAVAEAGNFTRAAAGLGIGQPPLSQQIQALERELGARLFERGAHGARLTAAGTALVAEARRVLDDAERAVRIAQRAARGESGRLRVGYTGSIIFNPAVPALIQRFKADWPEVDLALEETNSPALVRGLLEHRLDAAFLRPGPELPQGIRLHRYPDEPMLIALPASHRLAHRRRLPLEALAGEPFVLVPGEAGSTLYDEIAKACGRAGYSPRLAQTAPQLASVVSLVAAGLGVSIVPTALAQVQLAGVRYLAIQGEAPVTRLALAQRQGDDSAVLRNLIGLLQAKRSE